MCSSNVRVHSALTSSSLSRPASKRSQTNYKLHQQFHQRSSKASQEDPLDASKQALLLLWGAGIILTGMRLGSDNWCRQRVELGLQSLRCRQKGHLRSFPSLSSAWQVARAAPEEAAAHAQAYIQTRAPNQPNKQMSNVHSALFGCCLAAANS